MSAIKTKKKKKPDYIGQLIEVSDKCMSLHPKVAGKKLKEYPCNCRQNVMKILSEIGKLAVYP